MKKQSFIFHIVLVLCNNAVTRQLHPTERIINRRSRFGLQWHHETLPAHVICSLLYHLYECGLLEG